MSESVETKKTSTKKKSSSKTGVKPPIEALEKMFTPEDYYSERLKKIYEPLNYSIDSYYKVLKESIIGQDEAVKEILAIIYHNMYLNMLEDVCGIVVEHMNGLLVGPTGVGKTSTIRRIAKLFKVPCVVFNATQITKTGWVGKDVESIAEAAISAADGDIFLAQRSIIYIDEVDKCKTLESHGTAGRDINGTSVQEDMLKILEPAEIFLGKDNKRFDTHNLIIICGGCFNGLKDIREKRLEAVGDPTGERKKIGFKNQKENEKNPDDEFDADNPFREKTSKHYIQEDVVKLGFIPEFVGRFYDPIEFRALTVQDIEDIIYSKDSMLQQLLHVFNSRGVELIVDPLAFTKIAEAVSESEFGVRGLKNKIFKLLRPALYDTEQNYLPGICEIDADGNYTSVFQDRKTGRVKFNAVTEMFGRGDI